MNDNKEWLNYYDCVNENIFKEFDYESVKNDICFHLYTNLLYELMVCLMLENENHVKNKKELTKLIEKLNIQTLFVKKGITARRLVWCDLLPTFVP